MHSLAPAGDWLGNTCVAWILAMSVATWMLPESFLVVIVGIARGGHSDLRSSSPPSPASGGASGSRKPRSRRAGTSGT